MQHSTTRAHCCRSLRRPRKSALDLAAIGIVLKP